MFTKHNFGPTAPPDGQFMYECKLLFLFPLDMSSKNPSLEPNNPDLYQTLVNMFPNTPRKYIQKQAKNLSGKPNALEKFISEHLERNSQPPDDWQFLEENNLDTIEMNTNPSTSQDTIGEATF